MTEEIKTEGNGKLTDEKLLSLSAVEVEALSEEDKKRHEALLEAQRLERYKKDPYSFVEIKELVVAVMRNPKSQMGISLFLNNCKRSELDIAYSEINHRIQRALTQMDLESEMRKEAAQQLITPSKPHNMINGVRNMFKKG